MRSFSCSSHYSLSENIKHFLLTTLEPWCPSILYITVCLCSSQTLGLSSPLPYRLATPSLVPQAGVPNLWDLMPDDLRWSWRNNNRNKVHNKRIMLESSETIPSFPVHGRFVFCEAGPWYQKVWGPLPCRTCKVLTIQIHMWSNNLNLLKIFKDWDSPSLFCVVISWQVLWRACLSLGNELPAGGPGQMGGNQVCFNEDPCLKAAFWWNKTEKDLLICVF